MVLLAEGKINVLRNGQDMQIRSEDIVLGDIIQLGRGDQIPVDGVTVRSRGIEVDESPITGESETISKNIGDKLTSGTYLIGGSGKMRVTKVGADTFVNHLSSEAKQGEDTSSILLNTINRIIKSLTYVIIPLGIILFAAKVYGGTGINRAILGSSAAMIGMIPEGLVLLTSMTLAVSAMHLARKQTLVRDLPAIETLARVDVICLDKTGTITSGNLKFVEAIPMMKNVPAAEVEKVVAGITYGTGDGNETANAIKNAIDDPELKPKRSFHSLLIESGVGSVLVTATITFLGHHNLFSNISKSRFKLKLLRTRRRAIGYWQLPKWTTLIPVIRLKIPS